MAALAFVLGTALRRTEAACDMEALSTAAVPRSARSSCMECTAEPGSPVSSDSWVASGAPAAHTDARRVAAVRAARILGDAARDPMAEDTARSRAAAETAHSRRAREAIHIPGAAVYSSAAAAGSSVIADHVAGRSVAGSLTVAAARSSAVVDGAGKRVAGAALRSPAAVAPHNSVGAASRSSVGAVPRSSAEAAPRSSAGAAPRSSAGAVPRNDRKGFAYRAWADKWVNRGAAAARTSLARVRQDVLA